MDQTQTYTSNQTVVGYFDDESRAENALNELRDAGFNSAHLGLAHRGGGAGSGAKHSAESMWDRVKNFFEGSPENYADERTRGDAGTREITDVSGTTPTTGYDTRYDNYDVHHSLTGMSVPEHRSRYFSHKFRSSKNGALITVNAGDRVGDAERILRDNGGDLGDTASETTDYALSDAGERSGYTGRALDTNYTEQPGGAATDTLSGRAADVDYSNQPNAVRDYGDRDVNRTGYANDMAGAEDMQNIQLRGEVLRVHRERVNRGEVVVRKDVVNENQTVQVPVTRDEFVMERRPASGDVQASGSIGDGQEIRIPLTEETASIEKGTVVREEVAVGKKPVQEIRNLSDDVRREELVVDDQTTDKTATRKRAVNE